MVMWWEECHSRNFECGADAVAAFADGCVGQADGVEVILVV